MFTPHYQNSTNNLKSNPTKPRLLNNGAWLTKLLALFIIVPLVELVILIQIGKLIGTWDTIFLIIITGIVGAFLAKLEGLKVYRDLQNDILNFKMPANKIIDGVLVLIGGLLLLTPGILTDIFGLSLIIPITRKFYRSYIKSKIAVKFKNNRPNPVNATKQIESHIIDIDSD